MKSKKPEPIKAKFNKLDDTQKWALFLIGIVVAVAGFITVRNLVDRQKFNRVETLVETLSERVATEFDTEIIRTEKSCRNLSRKFEKGPLSCEVANTLEDLNLNYTEIIEFVEKQKDLVKNRFSFSAFSTSNNDVTCNINSISGYYQVSCSGHATTSHYEYAN